jgi:hypothetical protein
MSDDLVQVTWFIHRGRFIIMLHSLPALTEVCALQINAAAPPGVAGAVNGAGQAVSALMRAFGPFLGGLAWSLSIRAGFPGHQFLVFAGVATIAFFFQFTYALVDLPDLDK